MTNKVLVTGGSGFIGTNLVIELKKQGYEVVNLSKHDSQIEVETIKLDLIEDDLSELDNHKFDYVIHLAAISSIKNSRGKEEETMQINLDGTKKLLAYFEDKKLKKFILMSSVTVYDETSLEMTENTDELIGDTANVYSYSKLLAEEECKKHENKLLLLVFRLANAYGPYQRIGATPNLIPQVISQALKQGKIEIYNGSFARDFIYVSDVVDAIILGMKADYTGTLNLGTGKSTKVGNIAKIIQSELGGIEVVDLQKKIDAPLELVPNITLIQDELQWRPKTTLKDGLKETIKYYKNNI